MADEIDRIADRFDRMDASLGTMLTGIANWDEDLPPTVQLGIDRFHDSLQAARLDARSIAQQLRRYAGTTN